VAKANQPGSISRRQKASSFVLAVVVASAVAIVSFLPGRDKRALHSQGRFHAWGHLVVFSVVGYVAASVAQSRRARVLAFCAALVFGAAIEVGEHLVFGNSLERKDILVDALGVIAGTLLAATFAPKRAD
jgi:ethanolamine transporter EutH